MQQGKPPRDQEVHLHDLHLLHDLALLSLPLPRLRLLQEEDLQQQQLPI